MIVRIINLKDFLSFSDDDAVKVYIRSDFIITAYSVQGNIALKFAKAYRVNDDTDDNRKKEMKKEIDEIQSILENEGFVKGWVEE